MKTILCKLLDLELVEREVLAMPDFRPEIHLVQAALPKDLWKEVPLEGVSLRKRVFYFWDREGKFYIYREQY